ncbi:MAG: L,D-transpeptidase [Elusimicrobiota bacterium]
MKLVFVLIFLSCCNFLLNSTETTLVDENKLLEKLPGVVVLTEKEDNQLNEINRLVVNIPSYELFACKDIEIIKKYKISVGCRGLPTVEGIFTIDWKMKNAPYRPIDGSPYKKIADSFPSGENNPMGTRKMHFWGPICIHGLSQEKRKLIGGTRRGSCIALLKEDIEELYDYIRGGTKLEIYYKVNKIIKKNATVEFKKYPDLYNGYRRIIDNPELQKYPHIIKKVPVYFLDIPVLKNMPVNDWNIDKKIVNDTLLIIEK